MRSIQHLILKKLTIGFLIIAIVMTLLNPSEKQYLSRVAADYGQNHEGMSIGIKELMHYGSSQKSNYILFSAYSYEFGNMRVSYWGVLGIIFYSGSRSTASQETERWG